MGEICHPENGDRTFLRTAGPHYTRQCKDPEERNLNNDLQQLSATSLYNEVTLPGSGAEVDIGRTASSSISQIPGTR